MDVTAADIRSRQSIVQPVSLLKLIFDGFSIILVLSTWLIFKYIVRPVRRPFLCSDLNLYHPKPPKNVIPSWLLFLCGVIVPIIVILLSEGVRWFYLLRKKAARVVYKLQIRSTIYNIPEWAGNLYIIIGIFVFASAANSFLTNVGKVAVGRHRPHFIPSCFNQTSYLPFCVDPNAWIVSYTCIGESSTVIVEKDGAFDIRQSFPSGHSSTAFCGLIFLALYIYKVWRYRNFGLLPYLMEIGCFALAAYIGITRITDHRHHPTDVLGGAILGTVIAIIAFRSMVRSFKRSVLLDLENET
ncbi:unnamed protein product [Adineta steineri]|uniref:Phosphatidic acid phosphatase type 2/haloperoxidase domain-containing protein n=1 Tax=Adineta steineri TaxID=433720 RepID=A0A814NDZ0_9BILA|nr:unnamed protein product [Adineta steineri]CAF1091492.1 unnamed protein product [Adineta steineri]CAF3831540.1 unnamed protein product [Adineta steineri]